MPITGGGGILPAMRPDQKKSDDELLAWAGAIVAREQQSRMFGIVSVHMEAGRITRVTIESSELPPVTNPPKK